MPKERVGWRPQPRWEGRACTANACDSGHPDHFWKAGRYKLAAPVLKTGSAQTRGRSITDAFRHFGHVPTLNRNPPTKGNLCDLLSVTKASCSIERATNQTELFESDQRRSRTSFFVRCDGLVQSRNWNSSRSSRAERPPDKRKTAERYRAGRPSFRLPATAWQANFPG